MQIDEEFFMRRAIELAIEGTNSDSGGPFGAVVVKDGKIIAEGFNKVTSTNDPTAHAEMVAIRKACLELESFQLEDCVIYTSCEPCPMCLGAIYWARPKQVYYACRRDDAAAIDFDDQLIYDEIAVNMSERQIPFKPLLRTEGLEAFKNWTEKMDRTEY